jgi:predicted RNA-binding Zn ribbon-like protein
VSTPESPPHVRLLRDFANTRDVEDDTDALSDPAALTTWLADAGLLASGGEAGEQELALARRLRDELRATMAAHHDGHDGPGDALDEAAGALPLRLGFAGTSPRLRPADDGVRGALSGLVVAVADSVADGSWPRLKLCRAADCQWAFHDLSKNHSRAWCAMGVCGNRRKTRAYRARRRATLTGPRAPDGAPSPSASARRGRRPG